MRAESPATPFPQPCAEPVAAEDCPFTTTGLGSPFPGQGVPFPGGLGSPFPGQGLPHPGNND
jgi:hypothetical protein